LIYMCNW